VLRIVPRDLRIVPRDLRIVPRSLRFVAIDGKFSMLSDGPKGEGAQSARLCPLAESWRELERKIRNEARSACVRWCMQNKDENLS